MNDIISPEQRKRALCYFFGSEKSEYELAVATGLSAKTLFKDPLATTDKKESAQGWFAVRTCDLQWRLTRIAPTAVANWPFWSGVISAFWATGALDNATEA